MSIQTYDFTITIDQFVEDLDAIDAIYGRLDEVSMFKPNLDTAGHEIPVQPDNEGRGRVERTDVITARVGEEDARLDLEATGTT